MDHRALGRLAALLAALLPTRLGTLLLAFAGLAGCDNSDFGRSCAGEPVLVCQPYEWAEVRAATVSPDALTPGDIMATARIHVELERCPESAPAHEVAVTLLIPDPGANPDAGTPEVEVFNILTVADGEGGDPVPGDGVIDVEVPNPLGSTIPGGRDVTLRFQAVSRGTSGCGSGALEIPYRLGG